MTYTRDDDGVQVAFSGLGKRWGQTGARVEFIIDAHDIARDQLPDTLPVVIDIDLRASRLPLVAWSGRAALDVPL